MSFKALATRSIGINVVNAIIGFSASIVAVRICGIESFGKFSIELGIASLLCLALELLPSNYSLYRIQDSPNEFSRALRTYTQLTTPIFGIISYVTFTLIETTQNSAFWISIYCFGFSITRYLDIKLQASGNLVLFQTLAICNSTVRLALVPIIHFSLTDFHETLWTATAISSITPIIIYAIIKNKITPDSWPRFSDVTLLTATPTKYTVYYIGSALKRAKDSLPQLCAPFAFSSNVDAGHFFLAFRGLQATVGQIRIIEALTSHRPTMKAALRGGISKAHLQAPLLICVCFVAIIAQTVAAGLDVNYLLCGSLSLVCWPLLTLTIKRQLLLSEYRQFDVNKTMAISIATFIAVIYTLYIFKINGAGGAASALFISESIAAMFIIVAERKKLAC